MLFGTLPLFTSEPIILLTSLQCDTMLPFSDILKRIFKCICNFIFCYTEMADIKEQEVSFSFGETIIMLKKLSRIKPWMKYKFTSSSIISELVTVEDQSILAALP